MSDEQINKTKRETVQEPFPGRWLPSIIRALVFLLAKFALFDEQMGWLETFIAFAIGFGIGEMILYEDINPINR